MKALTVDISSSTGAANFTSQPVGKYLAKYFVNLLMSPELYAESANRSIILPICQGAPNRAPIERPVTIRAQLDTSVGFLNAATLEKMTPTSRN